jgi:hypothetical protein
MLAHAMAAFTGRGTRARVLLLAALCAMLATGLSSGPVGEARAQPAGLNVGRDCQAIRSCNFSRRGSYRGCLSSYSCRVCRFVRTTCSVDGNRRLCQQMRCTWG